MSGKVIMLMVDAMSYDACVEVAGAVEGWVESGEARRQKMRSVLPSLSMPAYESLHTGTTPQVHGILSNSQHEVSRVLTCLGLHARSVRKPLDKLLVLLRALVRAPYDAVQTVRSMTNPIMSSMAAYSSLVKRSTTHACGHTDICARGLTH